MIIGNQFVLGGVVYINLLKTFGDTHVKPFLVANHPISAVDSMRFAAFASRINGDITTKDSITGK